MKFLITGISRGLGAALAEELHNQGHSVAGCARSAAKLESLAHRIPDGHFREVNVCNESSVASWAKAVLNEWGTPDILVNNAGIINHPAPLWEVTEDEFNAVISTNLNGVHRVIRHILPAMIERGSGTVVNLSSGWGRSTSPEVAPYCCSKWGIEGLSKALAQELPEGMSCIPLNPGIIDTEMLRSCFGESAGSYEKPAEWARRAAMLIANLKPEDNGQSLTVS